jgi:Integrase core domain
MRGVTLDFSRPGKPTDNAFIESLNGKFRAECLNANWFLSLEEVRRKCEAAYEPGLADARREESSTCRRRCELITLFGAGIAAFPLGAAVQQSGKGMTGFAFFSGGKRVPRRRL